MEPLRGWAPKGERLVAKVPHGHWQTMTFVAALRHDRIEAPWLIDGPINGEGFRTYVEKALAPTLKPGDLVFAKLKHLLRKAAARTLETVVAAIRELLEAYTAPECANYFANAGYGQA